jgi:hypothetical protein
MVVEVGSITGLSASPTFPKQDRWYNCKKTNCGEMPVTLSSRGFPPPLPPLPPPPPPPAPAVMLGFLRKSGPLLTAGGSLDGADLMGLGPEIVCARSLGPPIAAESVFLGRTATPGEALLTSALGGVLDSCLLLESGDCLAFGLDVAVATCLLRASSTPTWSDWRRRKISCTFSLLRRIATAGSSSSATSMIGLQADWRLLPLPPSSFSLAVNWEYLNNCPYNSNHRIQI